MRVAEPERGELESARVSLEPSEKPLPLRLAVAGGRLGIELCEASAIEPLRVTQLAYTLPHLRFPLDLSLGVRPFRHRRGELSELELTVATNELARWLGRRWRAWASGEPRVWPLASGLGIGVALTAGVLAFDLWWAPTRSELRLVIDNARGVGNFAGGPHGQALKLVEALAAPWLVRKGRVLHFPDAPRRIAAAVLPELGARVPKCSEAMPAALEHDGRLLKLRFARETSPPELERKVVAAVEIASLAMDADERLAAGDVEQARSFYLTALERAPREPELVKIVAQLDLLSSGRELAAFGLIAEAMPLAGAGAVGVELLARVAGAHDAWQAALQVCSAEPHAPLAAAIWRRLAELLDEPGLRLEALDRAVAASPTSAPARLRRLQLRVAAGDIQAALEDAEQLEALASGRAARHQALREAAQSLLDAGYLKAARGLFERALRYLPADLPATLGLARSLVEVGEIRRATTLFETIVDSERASSLLRDEARLGLARILVSEYRNLPQAIARVGAIAATPCTAQARALEGRWRAQLGDLAGASLAYARLREACETPGSHAPVLASDWLCEAADFETSSRGDLAAAERHLAIALRLTPHHTGIQARYRAAAKALSARLLERNPGSPWAELERSRDNSGSSRDDS